MLSNGTAAGDGISVPAAGKTGTANNFEFAAFGGYTPRLAGYVSRHVTEDAPKLVGADVRQEPHIIAEVSGTSPVVFRPNANIRKAQLCWKCLQKAVRVRHLQETGKILPTTAVSGAPVKT